MRVEGKTGEESIPELQHRAAAVVRREVPCPTIVGWAKCEQYRPNSRPRQLSFADYDGGE